MRVSVPVILLALFISLLVGAIVGAVWGGRANPCDSTRVVAYCSSVSQTGWNIREIQRSEEFLCVSRNLDKYLDAAITQRPPVLCAMIWRAAFLTGTREQISKAGKVCWALDNTLSASLVPLDLATDRSLAHWMLLGPGASPEFLSRMLVALADRDPSQWGAVDYTPFLVRLMDSSVSTEERILSAYALARWRGGTREGEQAEETLKSLATTHSTAVEYMKLLEVLGTQGWSRSSGSRPTTDP